MTATDGETGAHEEFVLVDNLSKVGKSKFVHVVEAKRSALGKAEQQCLLVIKQMKGNNGGGVGYGLITTGERWQMFRNDDPGFKASDPVFVMFGTMGRGKKRWMKGKSIVVEWIYQALRMGGFDLE